LWKSQDSPALEYYDRAESDAWLRGFWTPNSRFFKQFERLDLTSILDLACGKGRHAAQFIDRAGHVWLFDTSPIAIEACKARFAERNNVSYVLSETGRDLSPVPDESLTAVLSYDAMVHFEMNCVFGYLREIYRTLQPGGLALLHHSMYGENPGGDITSNPDWRAFMREAEFRDAAKNAGFRIESFETFAWGTPVITDALTLLAKP
jgi:ubiquinone/menaquinone biosynthesis C-methylase UbiE